MPNNFKVVNGVSTRHPKQIVWFQYTQIRHVQRASKDKWAKYEPVWMPLADYTAVARQVKTLIHSKFSIQKTACLNLTSGPSPPMGLVNSWWSQIWHSGHSLFHTRLACPSIHMFTWNFSRSHGTHLHVNHAFWFAPSSPWLTFLALGSATTKHVRPPRNRNDADNSLWHESDLGKLVSG